MLRGAVLCILLVGCYGRTGLRAINVYREPIKTPERDNQTCSGNECKDPCEGGCGLNTDCQLDNNSPICTCKQGFTGHPFTGCTPAEEPECTSNSECPEKEACLNKKCVNPCSGICGLNTDCRVINHRPFCACSRGFRWIPDKGCQPEATPECTSDALCAPNLACRRQHCVDPCAGVCGNNTVCQVTDHHPACACALGYTGNPFDECKPQCSSTSMDKKPKQLHLHLTRLSWKEAFQYCRSRDMHLLSISSAEEQQQVEDMVSAEGRPTSQNIWTSGTTMGILEQYIWITTGSYLEYTNWNQGEPMGANENCIVVQSQNYGKWRNIDCAHPDQMAYVMCESRTL